MQGKTAFTTSWKLDLLFISTGIVTALPLIWFACGARRLRLSTLGFFQYLAPSCQLLIAVFIYHETFTQTHMYTFGFIWTALIVYSFDSYFFRVKSVR